MDNESRKPSSSIFERVKIILANRKYAHECYGLFELLGELEFVTEKLRNKVVVYKWSGFVLLVAVPLISAALSILLGDPNPRNLPWSQEVLGNITFGLGATLTFMTIVNSIFRPSERFRTACMISIHVEHIVEDILCDLEEQEITEQRLHEMVRKYRSLLSPYQQELIALFHPDVAGMDRIREEVSRIREDLKGNRPEKAIDERRTSPPATEPGA